MSVVAVTGASGFIGRNLVVRLRELGHEVVPVPHDGDLHTHLLRAEAVVHLAGVNRPEHQDEFATGNQGMTEALTVALLGLGRPVPLIYSSSVQAALDNPYGVSKRAAEATVESYAAASGAPVAIFRLPGVFGKWCRPNYNSVVATFCHNISHDLPISISDPDRLLRLVYVDDVVAAFVSVLNDPDAVGRRPEVTPLYEITLGALAAELEDLRSSRNSLVTGAVGTGLKRALHATYLSYLEPHQFDYALTKHTDARGTFAEILRTPNAGQFSVFTAHPGVTRGGHYHHSKTEKFIVVQGRARFGFRHIVTGETHELEVGGDELRVVETVPGWSHDITNVGDEMMIVMLWANEVFDPQHPDTIAAPVLPK
ncbi:capsular biosynthesis protein [Devosia sp. Root413D1]|uniref:UDP-2-acetamido-2,6-beta-L-arabino-hexul-4-ose reductase n=1 Tax=Devosia sp. Root413D1 TaxID=1736531 RepID=UPI0006FCB928|nr:NAD-dependent epimerase/dehydratase family protein [Devosia sp. Root413D1]KQW79176.1 capsular biosynthesis protein [Devosia sp. Root413D1]